MYLFESNVENNKDAKVILNDYEVPKFFKHNLFECVSFKRSLFYKAW